MTTKERVIREALAQAERRLAEVEAIQSASPLSEIIALRQEWSGKLATLSPEKLSELVAKEKELFALATMQNEKMFELMDERVKLSSEITELNGELYFVTKKAA